MLRLKIAMQRNLGSWPLCTIIIAIGQMLGATCFQITPASGLNW
jgi:alpha-1,3-glucan synthase